MTLDKKRLSSRFIETKMNYFNTNGRKERIAMILILGVALSLFIIPVLCGPIETSLPSLKVHCPILTLGLTSDTLILSEDIIYLNNLQDFTLLGKYTVLILFFRNLINY